jgi:hypothetical protein
VTILVCADLDSGMSARVMVLLAERSKTRKDCLAVFDRNMSQHWENLGSSGKNDALIGDSDSFSSKGSKPGTQNTWPSWNILR